MHPCISGLTHTCPSDHMLSTPISPRLEQLHNPKLPSRRTCSTNHSLELQDYYACQDKINKVNSIETRILVVERTPKPATPPPDDTPALCRKLDLQ